MFSHKDSTDKQKEHELLLKHMEMRKVVFLKRKVTPSGSSYGTFFVLGDLGQCTDITYSIAVLLDKKMARLDGDVRAVDVMHVETVMRDISEYLYGRWDKVTLYVLE